MRKYEPIRAPASLLLLHMCLVSTPLLHWISAGKVCGANMKNVDIIMHNLDPLCAESQLGCDLVYSLYTPVRCPCPAVIMRININANSPVHDGELQELRNDVLDPEKPYTIISYLDQKYAEPIICDPLDNTTVCFGNEWEAVRWNHPATNPPKIESLMIDPAVSLQHNMAAFRAMQPEVCNRQGAGCLSPCVPKATCIGSFIRMFCGCAEYTGANPRDKPAPLLCGRADR